MASEKRILDTHTFWATHLIFDIEGTTTSITFVKDNLFPYVREHLEQYVNDNWKDEGFQNIVAALREQAKTDEKEGLEGFVAIPEGDNDEVKNAVIKNVLWQMDNDRKTTSLKDLQSLVMTSGYETGSVIGHIYDDVETNLKAWKDQGKLLYVYSSGSVNAQKLLFGHTNKGNLLNLFSGHFDTLVGPKVESASYRKIVDDLKCDPGDVLFFTDVPAEAKAAVSAGLQAILVSRVGNAPLSDQDKANFTVIQSFSDIEFEQNAKKQKMLNETNCDTIIDNKEVEHSSTYIAEAVSGEGDGKTKLNITVDTDVEMAEVEEKVNCTGASKEETEIMQEVDSCKGSDVNKKVQPNTDLAKDNVKSSENISEKNTEISGENEIEEKNSDVEGKKDGSVVAQNENKSSVGGEVGKESPVTDCSDNTVKSINKLPDNQQVSISNENGEAEAANNENSKPVDSTDRNVMKSSGKSDQEEKSKISPLGEDNVEISHTDKTNKDTVDISNADENNKADVSEADKNEVEKPGEASTVKQSEKDTKDEMTHESSKAGSDKEDDVKENNEISGESEGISCTTTVEIAENTVKAVDVTETNHDTECKHEILNEENKPLSDGIVTEQSEKECDRKIVTEELATTETKDADVCSVDKLAQKETVENEISVSKKSELQEKVIEENSVCSKMEVENCDVKSDTNEKDSIINEKSDAVETRSDSVVELQKEDSKLLNNVGCSGTNDVNEKENVEEESVSTENSKTEAACVNSVHETKDECSKVGVEKIINSNHEKENNSDSNEKEDMTVTSTAVNGKHCENDSCDIDNKEGNGDVSKVVEMTPNGDSQASHGNDKTDHEKTDTIINEKTESNTVVNGGTEKIADSVPEVKKVISDAANSSAEAISQPV